VDCLTPDVEQRVNRSDMPNESLSALEASWRKWLEWAKLGELAGMSAAGTIHARVYCRARRRTRLVLADELIE
jgi:hypothetical protein